MSNLPSNFGRTSPTPFNALNNLWSFSPSQLLNSSYNLPFSYFNNQLSYPYPLASQHLYNPSGNPYFNSYLNPLQAQARQFGLTLSLMSLNEGLQMNKKEKKKSNQQVTVNLISDDEEPAPEAVQLEKVSQDKNTCNSSKTDEYNAPPVPAQKATNKLQQKTQKKMAQQKKIQQKEQLQIKTRKTKQVIKQPIINIKKKQKIQKKAKAQLQRQIFSKRIIGKQDQKKEPFKVSKRQSFLRDSNPIIMTGPQFQAQLPKFINQNPGCISWLKTLKNDLLSRQYKEFQQ